ncbi:centrosomal protein 43-like [Oncorhynchus keta]|uniref:centrosomal protein 43-like n=1 Tax=Oncorhynchus keta TaxID=8018 RepID=UPI00227B9681|nr:centrosomal protein 43-like [Oncorhynchus keta]
MRLIISFHLYDASLIIDSLIIDLLQVFHVDFTLAVFQPEINSLNGLDSCEQVSRDLGITETDMNRTTPLLLELVKRDRHREKASIFSAGEEASHSDNSLNFVSLKGKGQGHVVSRYREAYGDNGNAPVAGEDALTTGKLTTTGFVSRSLTLNSFVHSLGEESLSGRSFTPMRRGTGLNVLRPCLFRSSPRRAVDLGRGVSSSTLVSLLLDPASQRSAAGGGVPRRRIPPQRPLRQQERHPSDISKSEVSIGGEIEEVSVEGHDNSNKFDEITQDLSVSQLSQTQGADDMEVVA